jgi:hypothetical protein
MFRDSDIQRVVNLLRISPFFSHLQGRIQQRRPKHVAVRTVMTRGVGPVRNNQPDAEIWHGSRGQSPACHRGGPGSIPGQPV